MTYDTTRLRQALVNERIRREAMQRKAMAETAERDGIVAGLHAAFHAQADGIMDLHLMGDYGRPVPLRECQGGYQMCHTYGITIRLGSRMEPAELVLSVRSSRELHPATITLSVKRLYPFNSHDLMQMDGHLPPSTVIGHFLDALVQYIHPNDLGGKQ